MKHFNKQLEVNLNLIEPNNPKQDKKTNMEGINIIILIALGITGLFFYINTLFPKASPNPSKGITANAYLPNDDKEPITAKKLSPERLIFEGHKEAGEEIKITIARFNKKANYQIDFGDGVSQKITARKVFHTYQSAGDYDVQLSINYKDDPIKKVNKSIQIDASIEVIPDAYTEK